MYGKRKYGQSSSYNRKRGPPATAFAAKVRRLTAPRASFKKRSAARSIANARIGGFLGIENKFYDTGVVAGALGAPTDASGGEFDPASVNCISAPAQGDGESNRDGKNIKILSCHVAGVIAMAKQADQTAADFIPTVMVALVLDTQTNGAQLASENVYTNPSGNAQTCTTPLRNLQYSKRFKVLASKILRLPQLQMTWDGTNVEQSGGSVPFRFDKRLNLPVTFNGTTAGVASVVDNSLHIIAYAENTTAVPTIYYNARVRFVG